MVKSKVHMSKGIKRRCHIIIHSAASAAAGAGAIPIPMSDTIPITATQIGMIISLGEIFDIKLSEVAARHIISVTLTKQAGRAIFSNILKCIPGTGTIAGSIIGAATAAIITEALGWVVADDFYQMSNGEKEQQN